MASAAFAIGVSLIPGLGPIAGGVLGLGAAAAGAFIDQRVILPWLFPQDTPKYGDNLLGDIPMTTASEGKGFPFCLGPKNRVPGIIIWSAEPFQSAAYEFTNSAGKGGGGSRPGYAPYQRWKTHLAIAYNHGRQINELYKMKASGRDLYDKTLTISQTGDYVGCWSFGYLGMLFYTSNSNPNIDFAEFLTGYSITISGFTGTPPNGTYTVVNGWHESDGNQYLEVSPDPTAGELPAVGKNITFYQVTDGWKKNSMSAIYRYNGSLTQSYQTGDMLIGYYGSYPCNFRDRAFASIKDFHLTEFANQYPKFDCFVDAVNSSLGDPTPYLYKNAIKTICTEYGDMATSQVDVDDVDSSNPYNAKLEGYNFFGLKSPAEALQPIMLAANVLAQENGSKIRFFHRHNANYISVWDEDLGAYQELSQPEPATKFLDAAPRGLPRAVTVEFYNIHDDLQKATVSARWEQAGDASGGEHKLDLPIAMSRAEAKAIAKRILWTSRDGRRKVRVTLPPKYSRALPGDILNVTFNDRQERVLVTKRDRGANGLLIFEGVTDFEGLADITWTDSETTDTDYSGIAGPPKLTSAFIDVAPLSDDDALRPTIYVAAAPIKGGLNWQGALLCESHDGTEYKAAEPLPEQAIMGFCKTALAGGVSEDYWDELNEFEVGIISGELESFSAEEVLNGANRAAVETSGGWEIIGFKNAVLQSSTLYDCDVYKLSGLLRGLCATEGEIGNNAQWNKFVYLNGPGIYRHRVNSRVYNASRKYKVLPYAADIDDDIIETVTVTHKLATVKPLGPCHIYGTRDGSNNLTIYFQPRSRAISRMFVPAKPNFDAPEKYEFDILDGSTVVRTITVINPVRNDEGCYSTTYSASSQTSDGLTPGDDVDLVAYQVSALIGRGISTSATV